MPFARLLDPATSHEAAQSVGNITPLKRAILDALQVAMTDEELILTVRNTHGNIASESGIRSRRAELVRDGFVEDTGSRSKTVSGRSTIVWVKA
jgi:hypothetical protein